MFNDRVFIFGYPLVCCDTGVQIILKKLYYKKYKKITLKKMEEWEECFDLDYA